MKIVRFYDDYGAYDSVWTDAEGTKPRPEPMHSVQYLRLLFRRVSEGRLQAARFAIFKCLGAEYRKFDGVWPTCSRKVPASNRSGERVCRA